MLRYDEANWQNCALLSLVVDIIVLKTFQADVDAFLLLSCYYLCHIDHT